MLPAEQAQFFHRDLPQLHYAHAHKTRYNGATAGPCTLSRNPEEASENMRVEFRLVRVSAEAIVQSDFDF